MWRRTYLLLIIVRLYFALSSSYLHPDENFQGPEVIADFIHSNYRICYLSHIVLIILISSGKIFGYPVRLTWEFTSVNPIRSVFPLWPIYGLPMLLLHWLWTENGSNEEVSPVVVFWTLRIIMFALSFVLEDWALYELVQSPRHRKVAVMLVASSYVTWTYQTHTFSNSIETLTVSWSLVLVKRITENRKRSPTFASAILAFVVVFGLFNRITSPAFLLIPGLQIIPTLLKRPTTLLAAILSALLTSFVAIFVDTSFYTQHKVTLSYLLSHPVITPFNNLKYNLIKTNLAQHGLHPWYQHALFNMPQLLGPVYILLIFRPELSLCLYSALSGVLILSLFQHQEARFLLPIIPLILSSVKLPRTRPVLILWLITWICFNLFLGILLGVYHQGGVIPTQFFLSNQTDVTHVIWWKTYSPPNWLLDDKSKSITTHDLMGTSGSNVLKKLNTLATCEDVTMNETTDLNKGTYLIAPFSATYLDKYVCDHESSQFRFKEMWRYKKHLNLDDVNFSEDGFLFTLKRVLGRRGIVAWRVTKICYETYIK